MSALRFGLESQLSSELFRTVHQYNTMARLLERPNMRLANQVLILAERVSACGRKEQGERRTKRTTLFRSFSLLPSPFSGLRRSLVSVIPKCCFRLVRGVGPYIFSRA